MTTNLKWLRLVAMIALLAIVATACASDSGDDATEEDADADATEETVDEPTEEEATDEATEEDEPAEEATTEEAAEEPAGDGAENLKMAYILPETGQLAFLGPPQLLLLDEPTTGLDPIGIRDAREWIGEARERGCTILISSHILSEVERTCDRIAILHEGSVRASGRVSEVVGEGESLEDAFVRWVRG